VIKNSGESTSTSISGTVRLMPGGAVAAANRKPGDIDFGGGKTPKAEYSSLAGRSFRNPSRIRHEQTVMTRIGVDRILNSRLSGAINGRRRT